MPGGSGASRKSDIPNEVGATFSDVCVSGRCRRLMLSAFPEALLPLLMVSEDVAGGDVIRSLRRMSALEAASSDSALPIEESLWTLTRQRQ